MADWKTIDTLPMDAPCPYKEKKNSREVMLWVSSDYYTGPVIGSVTSYETDTYASISINPAALGGYEWDWDFEPHHVTHWAPRPDGPSNG